MNRKNMPLILMLTAGGIASIITFVMDYAIVWKLLVLLIVLLVFYALGSTLKWMLDSFDKQNEKAALDEGEVIEKEQEQAEDAAEGADGSKEKTSDDTSGE